MGREIRRVPAGWEHPRDLQGRFTPLHDRTYAEAAAEHDAFLRGWYAQDEAYQSAQAYRAGMYPWEWDGGPPDERYYRPAWASAECYQVYETVSEGTPVSPVFETLDALREWLVLKGFTPTAAAAFAEEGWAPSLIIADGKVARGIAAMDMLS